MVKVIMGVKGSGKTKLLIELVEKALEESQGDVVVIEKERSLTYDIPHQARLIVASNYDFGSTEFMKGFISAMHASNYDITHVFIDNLYKMFEDKSVAGAEEFLEWLAGELEVAPEEVLSYELSAYPMEEGCLWGLCVNETMREDWISVLGEPDGSAAIDEEKAEANRLVPGTCDYYSCGEYQLRLYSDDTGCLICIVLTA